MDRSYTRQRGFTLIELLVVIAIIALLVGILLPSLAGARNAARSTQTANNARQIAIAVASYTGQNKGIFPAHYVYGADQTGLTWKLADQLGENPQPQNGYIHWSYALFGANEAPQDAFTSPFVPTKGGAPRTNPGTDSNDWEPGQTNDQGNTTPTAVPTDRQVKRVAFAGNAALFPRNKFSDFSNLRQSVFVRDAVVSAPSKTILVTELLYTQGWSSLKVDGLGVIKSHRPITPFRGISAASEFQEPITFAGVGNGRFRYPTEDMILGKNADFSGVIDSDAPINAVGRQQPNKDKFGGGAQFAFVDAHVEQSTLWETVKAKKWGDKFWSITGDNRVDMTIP